MKKTCIKCGISKQLDKFYCHPQMADGHLGKCITCCKADALLHRRKNLEKVRRYDRERGKLPHRIKANSDRNKVRRKTHPLKYAAQCIVNNAIRDGRIVKGTKCYACGTKKKKLMGHHDDYYKPLDVIWLCQVCHFKRHKEISVLDKGLSAQ